jgi:DNA polymerase I-like protein with 3'-5' exonuclease and polymerase domains
MGDEIRGCLIADEGHILCGADLSNIESNTRNHYIKKYDNVYVESLQREDFDSHIDIAVLSGMMSKEDGEWFVAMSLKMEKEGYHLTEEEAKRYKPLKKIRGNAKVANFSCTYGVAKKTLSRNTGLPENAAQRLIDTYWERNWSVKAFAEDCDTKMVEGQMWIQNPVSGFWIALRSDRDKFSSVNQSTAVFCLDVWLSYVKKMGIKVAYQCHDEILFNLLEHQEQEVRQLLQDAMDLANQELGLNITVKQVPAFGFSYSTVH